MNGLMLHCGADHIDRHSLAALALPEAQGPHHAIRPFIEDVELVTDRMRHEGIRIQDEAFGVKYGNDGFARQFFGIIQARLGEMDGRDGYGLMIGLRGSHDQSLARALAVGSRVFVCDNLAFSGEIDLRTKQTTHVGRRLPAMLQGAVARIPHLAEHQHARFDAYHNEALTQGEGDQMLVELVRRGALMPSQLGRALAEWDAPSHDDHRAQGLSLWRLHNAVTEAIKPTNPERAAVPLTWQRTRTMTDYFDEAIGLDDTVVAAA